MLEVKPELRCVSASFVGALTALALLFLTAAATGQSYPVGTVRIVVPFTPGQGVDVIARAVGQKLSERWGQPVIVENKPGASGAIGTTFVARAPDDGHTLLMTSNGLITAPLLAKNPQYDPIKDFEPVGLAGWTSMVLVVNPNANLATVADLLRAAREQPGRISYASTGVGLPHHLAMELLRNRTGIDLLHVPYKGTTGALSDLLSGQVQVMYLPTPVAFPHIRTGKLRALALASSNRHPLAPDVPTFKELGHSGVDADLWYGLLAPKGTSRATISKIESDFLGAMALPEVRAVTTSLGMTDVVTYPAGEFRTFLNAELIRWASVVQDAGIKAD